MISSLSSLSIVGFIMGLITFTMTIYFLRQAYVLTAIEVKKRRTAIAAYTARLKLLKDDNTAALIILPKVSPAVIQECKRLKVECAAAHTRAINISKRMTALEKEIGDEETYGASSPEDDTTTVIVSDQTAEMEARFDKHFVLPSPNNDENALIRRCLLDGNPKLGVTFVQEIIKYNSIDMYDIIGNSINRTYTNSGGEEATLRIVYGKTTTITLGFPTSSPLIVGSQINALIYVDENDDKFCNNDEKFANSSMFWEMGEGGKSLKSFPFKTALYGRTLEINHIITCAEVHSIVCNIYSPNSLSGPIKATFVIVAKSGK